MLLDKLKIDKGFPLWPIVAVLFFHLMASIFSTGFYHWDEHFQILEFLSYFEGALDPANLPWEFHECMRSWVQPVFYYFIKWPQLKLGINNPFFHVFTFRLSTSLLSLYSIWLFWLWIKEELNQKAQKIFLYCSCLLWFLPFLHARHSSETFSAIFFISGLSIFFHKNRSSYSLLAGILMMVGAFARFQMAIPIMALLAWLLFFKRSDWKNNLTLILGLTLGLILCVGIDSWGYGKLTITPWNYLEQNLVQNKVSNFGVNPWYDYIKNIITRSFLPIGIFIFISILYFWKKNAKHPITWITFSFFAIHQAIGHKELRFLFPFVSFIPFFLAFWLKDFDEKFLKHKITKLIILLNIILLGYFSFKPAHTSYDFYQFINSQKDHITPIYQYGDENPYKLAQVETSYFKNYSIKVIPLKDDFRLDSIKDSSFFVFMNRGKFLSKFTKETNCARIYSSYPDFLLNYKIGKWPDKNKIWILYRCKN